MNWYYMKAWRWLADATVYLVILVTVSGVLLWQVLRTERTVGLVMLIAGAVCFCGMEYALILGSLICVLCCFGLRWLF